MEEVPDNDAPSFLYGLSPDNPEGITSTADIDDMFFGPSATTHPFQSVVADDSVSFEERALDDEEELLYDEPIFGADDWSWDDCSSSSQKYEALRHQQQMEESLAELSWQTEVQEYVIHKQLLLIILLNGLHFCDISSACSFSPE